MYISSKQNQHILQVKDLVADRQARFAQKLCVVEGHKLCKEVPLLKLFIRDGALTELTAPEIFTVTASLFDQMCDTQTPQGVLGVTAISCLSSIPTQGQFLYCDRIQDPGNLGTIIRTARGFGFSGVVVSPGTTDPFSPKVVRSSMGAVFQIPIIVSECVSDLPLIVAAMQGTAIREFTPPKDYILVVGNEGQGVATAIQAKAQALVTIPIQFESLNAAIAAAICMYQLKNP